MMDTKIHDLRSIVSKYIDNDEDINSLILWASHNSVKYSMRNISNSKVNIEETKFNHIHNIGIEYSKDSKNKLLYKTKQTITKDKKYAYLNDLIKTTSGLEKEMLRYLLFGIKCLHKKIEYDIHKLNDYNYNIYFDVLDHSKNVKCPECHGKNTTPHMIQTRAADEPPLVIHTCKDCKKRFNPPKFKLKTIKHEDAKDHDSVNGESSDDDIEQEMQEIEKLIVTPNGDKSICPYDIE
ncbi:RNA polymerase [Sea otter poxvirus]|uniref:RNA polymerase n=1 Tax=Sea otter poxvirus TaxID=1416741 RepID=A0A2U9QHK0_9POXV|nr:RNA polymerase [Sea otter poxvirus]AWU47073.1 RNA polymerase [Sea otter poxvirus]